ncbi:MAG: ABC transporter substrate-binding protein [Chloroflexi bacterium]|nr:ABC transporter substrate-binding protein [Chloroflexota bacterium]
MIKATRIVQTLVLLALIVASCAPVGAPNAPAGVTPTAPAPPTERPSHGGTLTLITPEPPPHFDMHQQTPLIALGPLSPNYSLLVKRDPKDLSKVVPDLAEKWETSPDGLAVTFTLRKDVKWHDGKPFTAADAVASLDRILSPPKGIVTAWRELFPNVARVEQQGDYVIRVILKRPQASLLSMLSFDPIQIYPKHVLDAQLDMKKSVVGTGPFKFKGYVPGISFESVRNPDYYLKGLPYLDGLKYVIVKDPSAQLAAFRTGQIDVGWPGLHQLEPKEIEEVRKTTNLRIYEKLVPIANYLALNNQQKPFNDVRVRRAVDLVIDRQAVSALIGQGAGVVGWYMMPGTVWAVSDADLGKKAGYRQPKNEDIAEAKRLMTEAGYPKGFSTSLITRGLPRWARLAEVVQDQLKPIGVTTSIRLEEYGTLISHLKSKQFEMTIYTAGAALADPDAWLGAQYVTGSVQNYAAFRNERFDKLFTDQSVTEDFQKRRALVLEMQNILAEQAPLTVLFWENWAWVLNPRLRGFVVPADSQKLGLRFDNMWLAP